MPSTQKYTSTRVAAPTTLVGIAFLGLALVGVGMASQAAETSTAAPSVVTITATGPQFDAPEEIPSGWTTFRFENKSGMTHFALVEKLPEGIGIDEHQSEVAPLFQSGFEIMAEGEPEKANAEFGKLPEWFGDVVFFGGPGLVGPRQTAQATVNLTPGTYLIECYVKTNGTFHSYNPVPDEYGMVHEVTVTDEANGASAPEAGIELSISKEAGVVRLDDGSITPGRHTVAVHFEDQATHKNFVGHDVHLVKIGVGANLEAVADWMDWTKPHGLETPAPASFVGGTNEMPAVETGYFTVDLSPGNYAWIAEVPNPQEKNMLKQFTVPSESSASGEEGNE